jgi:selenocysteine lyase/cysteine desulfurase
MQQRQPATINPADESWWSGIRDQYAVNRDFINLENGYFGIPSRPVLDAFARYNTLVNQDLSYFMRTKFEQRLDAVMSTLADFCGVSAQELAITRNATEAMNILIQGYPFRADDRVVVSNLDYGSVLDTLDMMEKRERLQLTRIRLPLHPANDEEVVSLYENAITPRTRVLVLTHMLHIVGQVLPVAKIAAMARSHGVDVFVDAAHSFAQLDYRIPDLNIDFTALNLHKWLGAPLGVGLLYVRKPRIAEIGPLFGDVTYADGDIRKLTHFGTLPPAPILAIEDAIAFHRQIGGRNKEARLRYLKDYWVSRVKDFRGIELLTPDDPARSCAIAAFRVKGMDADSVVDYLFDRHRIFTVAPKIDGEGVIRVTPHLHNTTEQLQRLVDALQSISA